MVLFPGFEFSKVVVLLFSLEKIMNKVRKTDEDPKFIPYRYLSEFSLDLIIAIAKNREFKVSYFEN